MAQGTMTARKAWRAPGFELQGLSFRIWGTFKIMVPFLGPYYNTGPNLGDPKRDHNFDNPPSKFLGSRAYKVRGFRLQ